METLYNLMPEEDRIRKYWKADKPFDTLFDGFDRLSALTMLKEIDRLRKVIDELVTK